MPPPDPGTWRWSYGVTVSPRAALTLERTLRSLQRAGFVAPRLFVDGGADCPDGFAVTARCEQIGAWSNWYLAAHELYQRDPHATAFAMFQDDIMLGRNLRAFLEHVPWPEAGYLNLYTASENGRGAGWFHPPLNSRGALGLVFNNATMRTMLTSSLLLAHRITDLGFKKIDVAVTTALADAGISEFVHDPSLIEHQGPDVADVPANNSTLGHDYDAVSASFPGEYFDCLSLLDDRPRGVVTGQQPRVGLIGFNTATGIGSCNRDLASHLPIRRWIIVKHPRFPTLEAPADIPSVVVSPEEGSRALEALCREIDVLISVETEFVSQQSAIAHRAGVSAVCVPMIEWLPSEGWPDLIDVFLCPTHDAFATLNAERSGRCRDFPWPIDVDHFTFRQRTICDKFLFVNGHGGHNGRKGGDVVRRAAAMAPEASIVVYDQTGSPWPTNCDVRGEAPSREALYQDAAVLLLPARFNGIGLEQLEGMAAGLPVIATDAAPMNESPCLALIRCREVSAERGKRPREILVHHPDPVHLAELLCRWRGRDIRPQSLDARRFAESRSWESAWERLLSAIGS